jgi:multiple sugar transport system substrate-binding protein
MVLLAALCLAASAQAWTLKEAAKPYSGQTVRIIGQALPPYQALKMLSKEFTEETGIKVIFEEYAWEEIFQKVTADFAGRTGIYDINSCGQNGGGRWVEQGWLLPLDKFLNDPKLRNPDLKPETGTFIDPFFYEETCKYAGVLYGFPLNFMSQYVWYRFDLFENPAEKAAFKAKYGYELPSPPVDWKEYRDAAEFFTRKKGEKLAGAVLDHDFYGTVIQGKRHTSIWHEYYNFLWSFGGDVLDMDPTDHGHMYKPVVLNSPAALEALKYYKEMKKFSPPGVMMYTWDEAQAAQQQGLVAIALQWDDAAAIMEDAKDSKVAGKTAYSGIPIGKRKVTQLQGDIMHLSSQSRHPQAAWLFMQWAMQPHIQVLQQKLGGESSVRATYDDPDVRKIPYAAAGLYVKSGDVIQLREPGSPTGHGISKRYVEAKDPATGATKPRLMVKPSFPEEEQIQDIIILMLNRVLNDEITPEEGLKGAHADIEKLLAKKIGKK